MAGGGWFPPEKVHTDFPSLVNCAGASVQPLRASHGSPPPPKPILRLTGASGAVRLGGTEDDKGNNGAKLRLGPASCSLQLVPPLYFCLKENHYELVAELSLRQLAKCVPPVVWEHISCSEQTGGWRSLERTFGKGSVTSEARISFPRSAVWLALELRLHRNLSHVSSSLS